MNRVSRLEIADRPRSVLVDCGTAIADATVVVTVATQDLLRLKGVSVGRQSRR